MSDDEIEAFLDFTDRLSPSSIPPRKEGEKGLTEKAPAAPPEVMDALKSGKAKKVKKGGIVWTLDKNGKPVQVK
jgi:hypothetical protein